MINDFQNRIEFFIFGDIQNQTFMIEMIEKVINSKCCLVLEKSYLLEMKNTYKQIKNLTQNELTKNGNYFYISKTGIFSTPFFNILNININTHLEQRLNQL